MREGEAVMEGPETVSRVHQVMRGVHEEKKPWVQKGGLASLKGKGTVQLRRGP